MSGAPNDSGPAPDGFSPNPDRDAAKAEQGDARFVVTIFPDRYATTLDEYAYTLADIEQEVIRTNTAAKDKLPLLKLARFGSVRDPKTRCFRTDANMLVITGIEVDYDGEKVGFFEACEKVEAAGIEALVYTSPSHHIDKPRWRVLCPTSEELPPGDRDRLVARLNGALGGIVGKESFTLSQSYYYGSVNRNPHHRVRLISGQCIDLLDDLDDGAIGKPDGTTGGGGASGNPFTEHGERAFTDEDYFVQQIMTGAAYHTACTSLAGKWAARNVPFMEAIARLRAAFEKVSEDKRDDRWRDRYSDITRTVRDIYGKEARKDDEEERVADEAPGEVGEGAVTLDDFYAFLPSHTYIYTSTDQQWPMKSVNSRLGMIGKISAATWLDRNRAVQQLTWMPGEPRIITDRLPAVEGGWIAKAGASTYNLYRPPVIAAGNPEHAKRWVDHIRLIYPDDADHIINYLAHRVQKPGEKINHAIVLGGTPGIGKDTILTPVRYAIGEWNFKEANPAQIMGRFNGYLKAVILRVSEAHDLGETDRFKLYEHMKTYTAAPPEFHRVDEKNIREYPVPNVCGVFITTNYKTDSLYLPADDRRHYVAWTEMKKEDPRLAGSYFDELYAYYDNGGNAAVAAYLQQLDISEFKPKAPPKRTAAFWAVVEAGGDPDILALADILDNLDGSEVNADGSITRSPAITLDMLQHVGRNGANGAFLDWLADHRNRRAIPHKLDLCGYTPVRNEGQTDGRWKVRGKNCAIYALKTLSHRDQLQAAKGRAQPTQPC